MPRTRPRPPNPPATQTHTGRRACRAAGLRSRGMRLAARGRPACWGLQLGMAGGAMPLDLSKPEFELSMNENWAPSVQLGTGWEGTVCDRGRVSGRRGRRAGFWRRASRSLRIRGRWEPRCGVQSCDLPSGCPPATLGEGRHTALPTEGARPAQAPGEANTFLWVGLRTSSRPQGQRGRGTAFSGQDGGQQSPGHAVSWPGLPEWGLCREWCPTPCSGRAGEVSSGRSCAQLFSE